MSVQLLVKRRKHGAFQVRFLPLGQQVVIVFTGEDARHLELCSKADVMWTMWKQKKEQLLFTLLRNRSPQGYRCPSWVPASNKFQVTELEMILSLKWNCQRRPCKPFENLQAFLRTTKTYKDTKRRWIQKTNSFTSRSFFWYLNLNSGFRIVLFLAFLWPRSLHAFWTSKSRPLSCFAKVKVTVLILSPMEIGDFSRIITPIVESPESGSPCFFLIISL